MALPQNCRANVIWQQFHHSLKFHRPQVISQRRFFLVFPCSFVYEEKGSYSVVMDFSRFVSPKAGYDPDGWKSQLYPNEIARNSWWSGRSRCSCNKSKRPSDVGCWMNHPSPKETDFLVFGPSPTLQLLVWPSLGGKLYRYTRKNAEASDYAFIPFGAGSVDLRDSAM